MKTEGHEPFITGRVDHLRNRAHGVVAVLAASLALSAVGTALLESAPSAYAAQGRAKSTRTKHNEGHGGQVQEFVKVLPDSAASEANGSTFKEQCSSHGRRVVRKAIYGQVVQPLGKCDIGKPVAITDQSTGIHKKIAKATQRNNHFTFIEDLSTPAPSTSSPATPSPSPTPSPSGGGEQSDPYASGNVGVDISWPQCGTPDENPSGAAFGIVDVNNGLGYSVNPCLPSEASTFSSKGLNLYVNTAWNSSSTHIDPNSPRTCNDGDENCLAYNYGYNAGIYAVNAATTAGISVNVRWWEDVESNATWSNDTAQNRQSLQGEHDALIDSGATDVGAYSTTVQWGDITGSWQNGWPSWGATTWTTAADAMTYCTGHQFTGGPSKLMQYLPGGIDHDVAC